jgi:hypothetical protein
MLVTHVYQSVKLYTLNTYRFYIQSYLGLALFYKGKSRGLGE